MSKALFLDRDGVINIDKEYVYLKEDFEFFDGIFDLCKVATTLSYKLIVVTNQAGIGRGYYTEGQFKELNDWMCSEFEKNGVTIDKVYYSPYHPEHGIGSYKKDHHSRKPYPGMIKEAELEFDLDLGKSLLVGDKYTDILAGVAAGVNRNILLAETSPGELEDISYMRVQKLDEVSFFLKNYE
ncbi:MAG TPA: HAD family hydrolase [Sphingobacteriaceae bacterium]